MKLPKPTSLRLESDIEQCEAAIADKTNSVQRNYASIKKDLSSLRQEFNEVKDSGDEPKVKKLKLTKLTEKRDLIKMKVEALETELEQFRGQQRKKLSLLEASLRAKQERMHGLLAYVAATGTLSRDGMLLFNTLGDLLEAKTDADRASGNRAAALILEHGDIFGDKEAKTGACDDEALRRFESISDPEERSAFYSKHRDEIQRGYDSRKNI
jgi:hypothetical protein